MHGEQQAPLDAPAPRSPPRGSPLGQSDGNKARRVSPNYCRNGSSTLTTQPRVL